MKGSSGSGSFARAFRRGLLLVVYGLVAGLTCIGVAWPQASSGPNSSAANSSGASAPNLATPPRSIDLSSMKFRGLSRSRSQDGVWHFTLDFIDDDRVLVTFETAALTRRQPNCPRTHDDRIVHAVVFDSQSGAVVRQADWYLHDHQKYLWALGSGQMLLRRGESLYQVDRDLNETLLVNLPGLAWTSVTPDGKQIVAETEVEATPADVKKAAPPNYQLSFIDAGTHSVLKTVKLNRLIPVNATSEGYAEAVLKNGWIWLVRFAQAGGKPVPVTRVRSACPPELNYSGESTLLIGRCTAGPSYYTVSSFTTAGQFLWRQRWPQEAKIPLLTRSASGVRFALSTIAPEAPQTMNETEEEAAPKQRAERLAVFDSATGAPVRELELRPAVAIGGNAALSPSGNQVAVLRDASVEIYPLPEPTKEQTAAFAAIKAGTPGLMPPTRAIDPGEELDAEVDEGASDALPVVAKRAAERPPDGPDAGPTKPSDEPAAEGEDQESSASAITFHSHSKAVAEDVIVTDSKGRPVTGLKKSDFILTEDGKPQEIRYFEEHVLNASAQAPAPSFKRSPNLFSNVNSEVRTDSSTLILWDTLNTPMEDQERARDALIHYLKNKARGESFAICTLSSELQLVRGFTTDQHQLLLSVLGKRARPSPILNGQQADDKSLAMLRSLAHNMRNLNDTSSTLAVNMALMEQSVEDAKLSQDDLRLLITVDAFDQLARYLSGIPGRKNVLWLSAAFPLARLASPDGLVQGAFKNERNFQGRMRQTLDLLASARVSVYPVDVRGVTVNSSFETSTTLRFNVDLPSGSLTTTSGTSTRMAANPAASNSNLTNDHQAPAPGVVNQNIEDASKRNAEHLTMDLIAEQTGGHAFFGGNDIEDSIKKVVEQGTNYYLLSYTPSDRQYDGQFRTIGVKVAGRGYHLAYRTGYYAEDPSQRSDRARFLLQNSSLAGMLHGSPESKQIPFEVHVERVGEPKLMTPDSAPETSVKTKGPVRVQHYVLDYAISASQLHFESNQAGWLHGSVRLLANSFDRDGRYMSQGASTASTDLKPSDYRQVLNAGLRVRQEMDVPAEAASLRLGVQDLASANIGTLELSLPVDEAKDDPLARRDHAMPPVEPE